MADYEDDSEAQAPRKKKLGYLDLMQAQNIVTLLDDEQLAGISAKVVAEYEIDEQSRSEWLKKNKVAIDLAMMVAEEKTYPFQNASNVKFPLVANAALQFNSRAYPAICPSDNVVKAKTYGQDPDGSKAARADRIAEHMSWQLMSQMPEWQEDTDRLTLITPIVGAAFRKVFYDPSQGRKVSRLVTADRMVFNYWARSFNDLPRLTEIMSLYPYEIAERINDGRFAEFDYTNLGRGDEAAESQSDAADTDGPHIFLEQHRLLDLDGDGYPEPYVVTVHKGSSRVCRIKANWSAETARLEQGENGAIKVISLRRQNYFVRYLFLPAPDGGAYGLGFGWLLSDINESINTTLNQTFDAAHLANIQGGFINATLGPKVRNQSFRFQQGEWKFLNTTGNLRDALMPITYPGPSAVLMTLLEFLINSGEKLASIKDVLTGDTPTTAPVGTTAMLIDQGLTTFTATVKRFFLGLSQEYKLHALLNEEHVTPEEYAEFFDVAEGEQPPDPKADYDVSTMDVLPVADPTSVTKAQRIAKAQAIYGLSAENPVINKVEATKRMLEAIGAEDIEQLMVPPPQPDPEVEALMKRGAEAEVAEKEAGVEKANADAVAKLAGALKSLADAEGVEAGTQMGFYGQVLQMLQAEHAMENDIVGQAAGQGGIPGMEGQPGDPMGAGAPGGGSPGVGAAGGGIPVQLPAEADSGLEAGPDASGLQQGIL